MEKSTKIGERFRCIRKMSNTSYKPGDIYLVEVNGAITNKFGNKEHPWPTRELVLKFFELVIESDFGINKGDVFICIEDVCMNDNLKDVEYFAGFIYKSERNGCITNNSGDITHGWSCSDKLFKHFKRKIKSKILDEKK